MRLAATTIAIGGFALAACAGTSMVPSGFADSRLAGALAEPVGLALVPDAPSAPAPRMLFVEQRTARVGLLMNGAVSTVGVIPGVSTIDFERGLLGIAVDPRWPASPFIYVHCTDGRFGHHIAISRFKLTGDLAFTGTGLLQLDAASRYDLHRDLPDNQPTHNGGSVRFGPDGRLYVSLGDDETVCGAQDTTLLAGKILRLDVSRLPLGAGGPPPLALLIPPDNPFFSRPDSNAKLVWALGLRNPFRFQIDASSGTVYVGDVGEGAWEEVDCLTAGGLNLGWPLYEGPVPFTTCATASALTSPITYYDHTTGVVVISAGLYRRPATGPPAFPVDYEGNCFFLDYYTGIMRRIQLNNGLWSLAQPIPGQPSSLNWGSGFQQVSDMLELPDGTMWYCRQSEAYVAGTGEIRRISNFVTTSVDGPGDLALTFARPAPTPSRGPVTLSWSQPGEAVVRLVVFDIGGRAVRIVEDRARFAAGAHSRAWDLRNASGAPASAGLYLARLEVGGAARLARIVVIR